eukprot:4919312-Alexandrium_andersonii.AAC.1
MPPAPKHQTHPLEEPHLGAVRVVGIEGKTVVVLQVWLKSGTVPELFMKNFANRVLVDARLKAGSVLDPLI